LRVALAQMCSADTHAANIDTVTRLAAEAAGAGAQLLALPEVAGLMNRNAEVAPSHEGLGERLELLPDRILIYTENGEALLTQIHELGLNPITSLVRRSSLEDVFLRLTGRTLVD
jgi:hypothetical protein